VADQSKTKVLILGAGLVARPATRYLLKHGFEVTVASRTVAKAEALIEGHAKGKAIAWTVDDLGGLNKMVAEHDIAVSLLPAPNHPIVARACLDACKHMVTTSYISPEMRALDEEADALGLILLNEIGVDPGIDHMSIMKIIDHVRGKGGKLTKLRSCCGGLPAPDANDNPWGYKFSWSPAGVLVAMTGQALFREGGESLDCPPGRLFDHVGATTVEGIGELESYPNRDSLSYIDVYGLGDIETMFRGTFRYPGWAALWKGLWKIGVLDRTADETLASKTFAQGLAGLIGAEAGPDLREKLAAATGLSEDSLSRIEWLGMLGDTPMGKAGTWLDCVADLLLAKLFYAEGERDMLVMKHEFHAKYPDGTAEEITSTMIDYGEPGGDSSMARTVSLPAAIAVRMILEGKIKSRGVHAPVVKEIYDPVLAELETLDIKLEEIFTKV